MKKKYLFLHIVLLIVSIGLIPLDVFLLFFPEWVVGLFTLLTIGSLSFFYIKENGKRISKIILTIITVLVVAFIIFASYCNPYWNTLILKNNPYSRDYTQVITFNQAKADIDYMMKYLKKDHPLFIGSIPDNVQQAYDKAVKELKSTEKITANDLLREIRGILSVLHDGHTTAYGQYNKARYLKYIYSYNEQGYHLVMVNNLTISQWFKQKSGLFSYEVTSWGTQSLGDDFFNLEGLDFLGIDIHKGVLYTYENEKGEKKSITCTDNDFLTRDEYYAYNKIDKKKKETSPFVSYTIDEQKSLAVLKLTSCDFNKEYRKCLKDMFTSIKEKGIKNVAVDLRENGGGNSNVANEFIRYLDINSYKVGSYKWRFGFLNIPFNNSVMKNNKYSNLTFNGKVYLLTSNNTFSSAMLFAEFIKDNKLGTIIGEPPGNTPSGYGEVALFMLPESKLYFQVSTKKFFRADETTKDILVSPDIACNNDKSMNELIKAIK